MSVPKVPLIPGTTCSLTGEVLDCSSAPRPSASAVLCFAVSLVCASTFHLRNDWNLCLQIRWPRRQELALTPSGPRFAALGLAPPPLRLRLLLLWQAHADGLLCPAKMCPPWFLQITAATLISAQMLHFHSIFGPWFWSKVACPATALGRIRVQ